MSDRGRPSTEAQSFFFLCSRTDECRVDRKVSGEQFVSHSSHFPNVSLPKHRQLLPEKSRGGLWWGAGLGWGGPIFISGSEYTQQKMDIADRLCISR